MPKICYASKNFSAGSLEVIKLANSIITAYMADGYTLTLRQLYYQFVSRDLIANTQREYKRLGSIINDARLAGMIDWNAIEDRTRNLESLPHWEGPQDIVEACASQFRFDKWDRQPWRIELWVEKEALAGVFEKVCRELDIPYLSCRGYTSQSEMWRASERLKGYADDDKQTLILHFGDHDPSGIDMTRDIRDRLGVFNVDTVEVNRVALNMNQVEQYDPPPNPAKITDSRAEVYIREFGNESWELDALDPKVLTALVRDEVAKVRDDDLWAESLEAEREARAQLQMISDQWDEVVENLEPVPQIFDDDEDPDGD